MIEFISNHILSVVTFFPLVIALALFLLPTNCRKTLFATAFVLSLVEMVFSFHLWAHFANTGSFEFMEVRSWIPSLKIQYLLGIDGVSLLLILLTTILQPLVILGSVNAATERPKAFLIALMTLQAGMVGVFCALDLILFYVFWEVMLVPMYFLIGIWGGKEKIYAALKFFIYTMVGSLLMLVGILYLYAKAGSFNLLELYEYQLPVVAQLWVFMAFALAFAIKVPLFPLHTWLPDAHVQAPTAGSVILAGVLLKMGTYGFFRFAMPLFPDAFAIAQPYLIVLCVIGIIYGALVAMVQPDMKKLVAYSSVSHLGVVMLGLFALDKTAIAGGLYQMLNHGVSTGALFLLIGVIYERTHSREISEHSGLAKVMPWYATLFLIVTFSSIGLPLTNGFIGEFLTFAGAFQTQRLATILATTGVVLGAVYMLWMVQRVFFGKVKTPHDHPVKDLSLREIVLFIPFVVFIIWMGVMPDTFLSKLSRPVDTLLVQMNTTETPVALSATIK